MAFNVYISHNTSPWELAHVYTLATEANHRGIAVFVPDRNWEPYEPLPDHIMAQLSQANVIVLFATLGGHYLDWVNSELSALQGKRILALVEPGISLQGVSANDIIPLQRQNLAESMAQVLKRLQSFRLSRDISSVMAGFLIGSLALLALRALTRED